MSNYLKKGKRAAARKNRIALKKRMKEVYKIMDEMEIVARELYKSEIDISEDNVKEEASKYTERTIGEFEKFMLLGKLQSYDKYDRETSTTGV
jgi:phosphate-selective porin